MTKVFVAAAAILAAVAAGAFPEIPKASYKALGSTRGKSIKTGLVFVNGKFVKPPYVVERWGTGIRINKIPVTGQVIDWIEFLKTQEGFAMPQAVVSAPSASPATVPPPPPPAEPAVSEDEDEDEDEEIASLDDLFDDDSRPKKKKKAKPAAAKRALPPPPPPSDLAVSAPPAPSTAPVPELAGKFAKNDASEALKKKINAARTEIDRHLRNGGFFCFGDNYARIVGDPTSAVKLLDSLPEILMRSDTSEDLYESAHAARLAYLHELVCEDLFRNRIVYRSLQELRMKRREDKALQKMMSETSKPLF